MFSSSKARLSVSSVSTSSPRNITDGQMSLYSTSACAIIPTVRPAGRLGLPGGRPKASAGLGRIGAGDLGEQRERLLPAVPRGVRLPRGELYVAEVKPRGRLALRVPEQLVHLDCPLVVRDSLLVVAELAEGVGHAVHGVGDSGGAARLTVFLQRPAGF